MPNIGQESIYKLPRSALSIYVKLYSKKKRANKKQTSNIRMEAIKSWVSLSKAEKQHFFDLFEEYKDKLKKKFAANLQNVQPYMKKKHKEVIRSCNNNEDLPTEQGDNIHNNSGQPPIIDQENHHEINNSINQDNEMDHCTEQAHCTSELNVPRWIPEPTPPLRSSMELFEIVKNNEESTRYLKWTDLSKSQKQKYQRAVLAIKKEYIKQYRAYLEQLTSEQLFWHYKSKITE